MRGGQHQVLLLLEALREQGEESTLLARQESPLFHAAESARFPVHPAEVRQVWKFSRNVEIVHAHDARAHTMAALASHEKFVVSRRVAFAVRRSLASRWKYRRAARYLAVSDFVAKELEAAGVPREQVDVVYDAVENTNSSAEWRSDGPAIALASSDPQKGRDLVEQAAQLSGIPVIFSSNLSSDLRGASLFVYVTRSEGLGSAALLAMNVGIPVIASGVGGLTEVFEDGVSGLFVRNDAREIADVMRRLREDHALANRLIQGGKARIQERFTVEHLVRGTIACYGRALGL
jgi:glycosyl transferase family 1/glycosyl transferase family 4